MAVNETRSDKAADLHKRAEDEARANEVETQKTLSPEETQQLLQELRGQQIDLRPQAEELRQAQLDLQEAHEASIELLENAEELKAFYASAPMLMGVVEMGEDDREIVHLYDNPATCRFFGLSGPAPTAGKDARELGAPAEAIALWVRHYRESRQRGGPVRFEYEHRSIQGACWLAATVTHIGLGTAGRMRFCYVAEDITERKRAEEELKASHVKLEALWNLASIADTDSKTISDYILSTITRMTRSKYGFYGFLNEDESVMTIFAWSGEAMKDCSMVDKPKSFLISEAGVWGEAVRRRKALVLNDYAATHVAKKGYPDGHVRLTKLLVVPVFFHDRIVSLGAVANRAEDYDESDVNQLMAFLNGTQIITERKQAEATIEKYSHDLNERVKELHCLYSVSELIRNDGISWREALQGSVYHLARAYTYPKITACRITWRDHEYRTENFRKGPWFQDGAIMVHGEQVGVIEVCYLEERPERSEGPFLAEERKLLDAVADLLGRATERKRAEERLRIKNLVFDVSLAANSFADHNGVITEANDTFLRLWDYQSKDEVVGKPIAHFLNDPNEAMAIVTALDGTGQWEGSFAAKKRDGSTFFAQGLATIVRDENGKVIGYQSSVLDITERKRAEKRLRESEERHRAILQTAMDGFGLTDVQGRLLEVNTAYCRMSGYSEPELLAMRITDLEATEASDATAARIQKIMARGEDRFETLYRRKDASVFDVEVSVQYRPTVGGRFVVFLRDITERKRAEERLRKYSHDLNERVKELHCLYSVSELIRKDGISWREALRGSVYLLARAYTYPEITACRITWRDHEYRTENFRESPWLQDSAIMVHGERVGVIEICYLEERPERSEGPFLPEERRLLDAVADLLERATERKQVEEELAQYRDRLEGLVEERTAELVAANQALKSETARRSAMEDELRARRAQLAQVARLNLVGGMAAGLAHELNQPLTAIQTYATCSLERIRLGASPLDDLRGDLEKIVQQTGRAGEVVRHIRQFIRNQESHRSTTDVNGVVQNAISLVSHEVAWRGIRLEVHLADSLPLIVVDPVQVEQVVLNLVQNAIDAMTGGGVGDPVLTVTTSVCPDNSIQVAIGDRGPGLAAEVAARLFEPFVTTKEGGLGLGLSICQTIVESHDGRLWASPNPQGGTTFVFSLPIQGVET